MILPQLYGDESKKQLLEYKKEHPELFGDIKMSGKGRTTQRIVKDMNRKLLMCQMENQSLELQAKILRSETGLQQNLSDVEVRCDLLAESVNKHKVLPDKLREVSDRITQMDESIKEHTKSLSGIFCCGGCTVLCYLVILVCSGMMLARRDSIELVFLTFLSSSLILMFLLLVAILPKEEQDKKNKVPEGDLKQKSQ